MQWAVEMASPYLIDYLPERHALGLVVEILLNHFLHLSMVSYMYPVNGLSDT